VHTARHSEIVLLHVRQDGAMKGDQNKIKGNAQDSCLAATFFEVVFGWVVLWRNQIASSAIYLRNLLARDLTWDSTMLIYTAAPYLPYPILS
jgi:hypothetical protein